MLKKQTADYLSMRDLTESQYHKSVSFKSSRKNQNEIQISKHAELI